MRQLRGEDARFVYGESGHANSNITLISIYDPSTARDGRVHFKELLKHIESRLSLSPIFRQKLLRVPLELDFPYWIEDESFDLEYHVRHIALPKPGDWRQFCIQASRIHARPLDLSRPLWELYLVEGLDSFLHLPPDSFAILAKVHHAAIDVRGGAEITTLLHDITAQPPAPEPAEPWFPESPPGPVSLLTRALINNVVRPLMFAGPLARAIGKVTPVVFGALGEMLRKDRVAVTRFNSEVSPHRVFDSRRFFIDEFKRIRDRRDAVVHRDVDALRGECALQRLDQTELHQHGIGDDHDAAESELADHPAQAQRRIRAHQHRRARDRDQPRHRFHERLEEAIGQQPHSEQHACPRNSTISGEDTLRPARPGTRRCHAGADSAAEKRCDQLIDLGSGLDLHHVSPARKHVRFNAGGRDFLGRRRRDHRILGTPDDERRHPSRDVAQ